MEQDRRRIEHDFFNGSICGVAATNALELGIDVGHIDATLHLGFPGSIARYCYLFVFLRRFTPKVYTSTLILRWFEYFFIKFVATSRKIRQTGKRIPCYLCCL